jgi:hypothetical protein
MVLSALSAVTPAPLKRLAWIPTPLAVLLILQAQSGICEIKIVIQFGRFCAAISERQ